LQFSKRNTNAIDLSQGGSWIWALPASNPNFDQYHKRQADGTVPGQSIWAFVGRWIDRRRDRKSSMNITVKEFLK
jgi:hypothetical protein